ncbi:hypothetical protein H8356DRAFT_1335733 [Neocallimastix lanati (nom. inval.)]|nr:hypothetical protein H8356DRAFT_1335733 [Neocallimastix sp. JGI-2020a]
MKHKIKDGIEKSSIPFGIKIKHLYNKISKEMGLICPEYNSIKSQISRNLNKKLPSNVTAFAEIPNESEYYKTKRAINKANEISVLIERYKNIEAKLIDAKCDRNNIINFETNKEKNQIIVNRKYKFNLWYITNNTKIFKCTKYKTVKKCKSYIILNDNNKVIKYENKHTHPGKEYDASVSIVEHKMKNEIRKTSIPFDINPKHI